MCVLRVLCVSVLCVCVCCACVLCVFVVIGCLSLGLAVRVRVCVCVFGCPCLPLLPHPIVLSCFVGCVPLFGIWILSFSFPFLLSFSACLGVLISLRFIVFFCFFSSVPLSGVWIVISTWWRCRAGFGRKSAIISFSAISRQIWSNSPHEPRNIRTILLTAVSALGAPSRSRSSLQ